MTTQDQPASMAGEQPALIDRIVRHVADIPLPVGDTITTSMPRDIIEAARTVRAWRRLSDICGQRLRDLREHPAGNDGSSDD